jgi:hypothetical protein
VTAVLEPREIVARGPPKRSIDRHLREIAIAAIGLVVGALAMLTQSAREAGATQEVLKSLQAQLATSTESIRSATTSYGNLLGVVQSQQTQIAVLVVQVNTLLLQSRATK